MKLSIITVNFNDAEGLERTIKSVISQTFRDYEFIIIDGGSTDGSVNVIKQYESRIDYWVSERDVLDKIFALETDADIITGAHSENGLRNVGKGGVTMLDLYKWAIDHQASFIRREVAQRHPYDEKYRIVSDWKFFIEALVQENCSFFYTDTIVVDVDMKGISNTNLKLDKQEREAVLKELFPERVLKDYQLLASIHPDVLKVAPRISQSKTIQGTIIKLARLLLKIKDA